MNKYIASIYPCPFDEQIQHDFNSSLFKNGELYCYEEGKITSTKNDGTTMFPERSLLLGMKELELTPEMIDVWILPRPRKIDYYKLEIFFDKFLKAFNKKKFNSFKEWAKKKVIFIRHHDLHAFSAIGSSGWKNGLYLNIDGGGDAGDRRHTTFGKFKNFKIYEHGSGNGFNGLASFHAFITEYCGFRDQNGKLTGFSGYGKVIKKLSIELSKLLVIKSNGIIFNRERYNQTEPNLSKLDIDNYDRYKIFNYNISKTNISKICKGYLPQDIAATAENIICKKLLLFLKNLKKKYKNENRIVFSGGLFLNVKINNIIDNSKIFKKNFFPPAPSDSGLSMGGVLSQNVKLKKKYKSNLGISPYLGPSFKSREILKLLTAYNLKFSKPKNLEKNIAADVVKKNIVGIFYNRAEYGQRSLGHRSIVADPRNIISKNQINEKVKKRDWFMPFAPAILDNFYRLYFSSNYPSLYMQKAEEVKFKMRKNIPAALHVDGTSRVQYVSKKFSPFFWKTINEYKKKTGIPIILNTSFNRHGISTISSPRQAIDHLLEGCIDVLYLNEFKIQLKNNRSTKVKKKQKFISETKNLKIFLKSWKKKIKKI